MRWYQVVLSAFAGTLLALASAGAFLWFRWIKPIVDWVYLFWTHPLDQDMPPFPTAVQTVTTQQYMGLWIPFCALAVVMAVEGGLIAWALLRKPK